MISAKVELNQPLKQQRQFVAQTGSGHHMLLERGRWCKKTASFHTTYEIVEEKAAWMKPLAAVVPEREGSHAVPRT